jgi:tetratricopeptide (TPR) repeat protein
MTHYDEETLAAYALDRALVDDSDALEAHLRECVTCRDEVEAAREFDALSRERETWDDIAAMRAQPPRLKEALAQRNAIVAEEMQAQRLLAPYLKSPLRLRNKKLANDRRFVTAGVVRMLCLAARGEHERRPRFSHALAVQACEIAARLDPPQAECAVQAYCERANALHYLGKFKEAERALDQTEALVRDTAVADFDLATIRYLRARLWSESERARDAIPLIRSAASTFGEYGDETRKLSALLVEGACYSMLNDHVTATEIFERIIALARRRGDVTFLARGVNNCAVSYAALRDFDRAAAYYAEAISLYEETGMLTEKTRAEWALAATIFARGDLAAGLDALDSARRDLAARGLTNDAALATLEWAEARLVAGLPAGVAKACARLVMSFESEGMERNARLALAYLHEALASGTATPDVVRHVRIYLEALPTAPARLFEPPS